MENKPSDRDGNPGYTCFGRIFEGWPHVLRIAQHMPQGFLEKSDVDQVVMWENMQVVQRLVPTAPELRRVFLQVKDAVEMEYRVVMFSKTTCPYCKKAKRILAKLRAEVHVIELDQLPDGSLYQDALEALTQQRTVPNVFIEGRSIGGGDDVARLEASGVLQTALQRAGCLAKDFILQQIKQPLVMFSKTTCPYCKKAKKALAADDPVIIELDQREDGPALQYYLQTLTGRKTVPNVFVGGKTIGGGDEVAQLAASGELALLLQQAKAT